MTDIDPAPDRLNNERPPLCPRCQMPVADRHLRIRLADGPWWHRHCWPDSWRTPGGDAA